MGTSSMDRASWCPWDAPDTFGKNTVAFAPGQAHLCQWPLKLSKVHSLSPFFHQAHLLIAADCTSFSYLPFHDNLVRGRVLAIGCPDLEGERLEQKISEVVRLNEIRSIRIVRMDAPCCKPLTDIIVHAVRQSGRDIPLQITTIFSEGEDESI